MNNSFISTYVLLVRQLLQTLVNLSHQLVFLEILNVTIRLIPQNRVTYVYNHYTGQNGCKVI